MKGFLTIANLLIIGIAGCIVCLPVSEDFSNDPILIWNSSAVSVCMSPAKHCTITPAVLVSRAQTMRNRRHRFWLHCCMMRTERVHVCMINVYKHLVLENSINCLIEFDLHFFMYGKRCKVSPIISSMKLFTGSSTFSVPLFLSFIIIFFLCLFMP